MSLFFCSLIIVKICAAVPLEMIRPWQLSTIHLMGMCMDRRTCTRRDLRTVRKKKKIYNCILFNGLDLIGRILFVADAVWVDLSAVDDGSDDYDGLCGDHTVPDAPLRHFLLCGVPHVQVPAAVRVYQRLSIRRLYVVCGLPILAGGADLRVLRGSGLSGAAAGRLYQVRAVLLPAAAAVLHHVLRQILQCEVQEVVYESLVWLCEGAGPQERGEKGAE